MKLEEIFPLEGGSEFSVTAHFHSNGTYQCLNICSSSPELQQCWFKSSSACCAGFRLWLELYKAVPEAGVTVLVPACPCSLDTHTGIRASTSTTTSSRWDLGWKWSGTQSGFSGQWKGVYNLQLCKLFVADRNQNMGFCILLLWLVLTYIPVLAAKRSKPKRVNEQHKIPISSGFACSCCFSTINYYSSVYSLLLWKLLSCAVDYLSWSMLPFCHSWHC